MRSKGQSLVEFALVGPVVVFLLFAGLMVLQHILTSYTVQQAADAAANQAALIGGDDPQQNRVVNEAALVIGSGPGMQASDATVTLSCASPCRRYSAITVVVSYTGDYWVPIGPFQQLTVTARATRSSEQDRLPTNVALRPTRTPTPTHTPTPTRTPTSTVIPTATATGLPTSTPTPTPWPVDIRVLGNGRHFIYYSGSDTYSFNFTVANISQGTAENVIVVGTIPHGVTVRSAFVVDGGGTATVDGNTVTWRLGTMGRGHSEECRLTLLINPARIPPQQVTFSATASTSSWDISLTNNTSSVTLP